MKKTLVLSLLLVSFLTVFSGGNTGKKMIWNIGKSDNSSAEFALAPGGFKQFIEKDFGFEDKYFIIGYSDIKKDFPYVLPGPVDTWGGTWPTSGWRTNQINILFTIDQLPEKGNLKLVISLQDFAKKFLPLLKVSVNDLDAKIQLSANGYDVNKQPYPRQDEPF
jgi:hypothetical protein